EAAERKEIVSLNVRCNSALNKSDVHTGRWITQPFQVIERTLGRKDFQFHPAARQYLLVFLGISLEEAVFRTACDGDDAGRREMKKPVNSQDGDQNNQNAGAQSGRTAKSESL